MKEDNIRNKLSSLEAFLMAETNDIDSAIKKLENHVDPESLRRRISLLLKADRVDDAYSLTTMYTLHSEWVESGIRSAVYSNDYNLAEKFVSQSYTLDDSTGTIPLRCIVSFSDSVLTKHLQSCSSGARLVSIYALDPDLRPAIEKSVGYLFPYCDAIRGRCTISSPLESEAVTILQLCLALIGRSDESNNFLPMLIQYGSVHHTIGQFMAEGRLPLVKGFSEVLVKSNPTDFFSLVFAALLKYQSDSSLQSVFTDLVSLITLADDKDKRAALFTTLSRVTLHGDVLFDVELERLKDELLDLSGATSNTILAIHYISRNKWNDAELLLDKYPLPNDSRWLRARAQCYFVNEQIDEGLPRLIDAALTYKEEDWLVEAADRAHQNRQVSNAIQCLECLRDYYPLNSNARINLVNTLIQKARIDEAIDELVQLIEILPENIQLQITLAQMYVRTNHVDKANIILTKLSKSDPPILEAILLFSYTLKQTGNVAAGFEALNKYKKAFWLVKEYLFSYMEMGYASGHENEANEALHALNELRIKGKIDPKLFRLTSLDEMLEFAQESRGRQKEIQASILQGKLPWTSCAEGSRNPILFDWKIRTQKLKWLAEDIASRASFSIYTSNCFGVHIQDNEKRIVEIESCPPDRNLCVDYSSLITLHALGKLPLLFSLYKEIYIPEQYRSIVHEDRQRLQPHQISHQKGYEEINRLLNQNDISIAMLDDIGGFQIIDEYTDDTANKSIRRLIALIECLVLSGKIQQSQEEKVRAFAQRKETQGLAPIALKDNIVIELSTLMTIFREGLLEVIVDSFRVYITENDRGEIIKDLGGFEFQSKALKEIDDLWNQISLQRNVQYIPLDISEKDVSNVALLSLKVAEKENIPLMVDDRVMQSILINSRSEAKGSAFGTELFLYDAFIFNLIDIDDYSNSIIQLIRWRYKFILPKAEVLHYFSTLYTGKVLGSELTLISQYMHDCIRDPGLFGGLEQSDPPISMALKLYMTWTQRIGEFLALVWTDEYISDRRADVITGWVAQIMVPSVPMAIQEQFQSKIALTMTELLIVKTLLSAAEFTVHNRVPSNLLKLSQLLGISNYRHEQLILEVLNAAK